MMRKVVIKTLFPVLFFALAMETRSQNQKVENFCQYQNQPIQKLLANLKSKVGDTRISRTNTGRVRSLALVFNDSSYFEIFPIFKKPDDAAQFNLKSYRNYKIKCLFYHVPGDLVVPCGCKSFSPSAALVGRSKPNHQ